MRTAQVRLFGYAILDAQGSPENGRGALPADADLAGNALERPASRAQPRDQAALFQIGKTAGRHRINRLRAKWDWFRTSLRLGTSPCRVRARATPSTGPSGPG